MYCKHCGKVIADDSRFCSSCGASQDLSSASVPSEEDLKLNEQSVKVSNSAYLWKRLLGSIIDKMIILYFSLIVIVLICIFDKGFSGELGIFGALFNMTKDSVYSSAIGHVMSFFPNDDMSQHQLEIDSRFQYLIWVELKIAYLFIVINIIYYATCEKLTSSSVGKSSFNLKLVSNPCTSAKNIPISKVLYRASCFFFIASGIISLRWFVGFNYYVVVALFFLIMDLPVLFKRASLLDILTKTKLISYNKDKFPKEEKIRVDYAEEQVIGHPNKVNRESFKIFNIVIYLGLIFLISLHVYFSLSFAAFKNQSKDGYMLLYNDTERFAGCGYYLSNYDEPSDVKEIMSSDNIFGRHISTLGFKDGARDIETNQIIYKYQCSISTYDISNIMSILGNNEKKYEQCLSLLAQRTQANETKIKDDIKALTWNGMGSMPTKFMGVCANGRLYIIKAESEENLNSRSEWLFHLFDFTYYQKIKYYQSTFLILGIIIGISCILFFVVNLKKYKKLPVLNRYAYSLFFLSLLSIFINVIIALVLSYKFYEVYLENWSIIVLIGTEVTALLTALWLSVFYYRKSKMKWDNDYIVPPFLKNYFYNNMKDDTSKRSFIKWVCYPLMILSLLPCGFYIVFIYSIPLLLLIIYNRWNNWVSASRISNQDE